MNYKKLVIFIKIVPRYIIDAINTKRGIVNEVKLPSKLGKYYYYQKLGNTSYPYSTGMYKDKEGNRVVVKIYEGTKNSLYYLNLKHEATVCKILSGVSDRERKIVDKKFPGYTIPHYVSFIDSHNLHAFVRKYVSGRKLSDIERKEKMFDIYSESISFIRFLGDKCLPKERKEIGIKTKSYYICIYPLTLAMSVIKHPTYAGKILKGVVPFIKSYSSLNESSDLCFIHGDLHPENILINKSGVSIIDMAQSMFSFPELELIATFSSKQSPVWFQRKIYEQLRLGKSYSTIEKRIKAMLVSCSTFNLTSDLPMENMKRYLEVLNYGISK